MKGFSTVELLLALSVSALSADLLLTVYEQLEPQAQKIQHHEQKKLEQICKFRKFEGC